MKNDLCDLLSTQSFLKQILKEEMDFIRRELLNQLFDNTIKNFANDFTVSIKIKSYQLKFWYVIQIQIHLNT